MSQDLIFILEQLMAFCIAGLLVCIKNKISSKKHIKETEE